MIFNQPLYTFVSAKTYHHPYCINVNISHLTLNFSLRFPLK